MATTEELARRFAALCGWGETMAGGNWVTPSGESIMRYELEEGWQGIGIVVEEMRRRGWDQGYVAWGPSMTSANFYDQGRRIDGDGFADGDCLDAVLTAANAALEAEARP